MAEIKIGSEGVRKALAKFKPEQSIAQYVWNGFDAGASVVDIRFEANHIGNIPEITIDDNGEGIVYDNLDTTFKPFYESARGGAVHMQSNPEIHGSNGIGRLTFQSFASKAVWQTVYSKGNQNFEYKISIHKDKLNEFDPSKPKPSNRQTGTSVSISAIFNLNEYDLKSKVREHLIKDFCWYLELNKKDDFCILINGERLAYDDFLLDEYRDKYVHKETGTEFKIAFYQWAANLNEYSKFYFIDSNGKRKHKENTTFNNKSDGFFHSVLIESAYFDNFNFNADESDKREILLRETTKRDKPYQFLKLKLNELLKSKRTPYLETSASKLIDDLEQKEAIPKHDVKAPVNAFRRQMLVDTLKGLYKFEPKLFSGLNPEQKIVFTRFINLALEGGGRDQLFKIIRDVIDLTDEERTKLADILDDIHLDKIITTIGLLNNRKKTIEKLKDLVFNPSKYSTKETHIQSIVENNTWIFGEEYNLTVAQNADFDTALRKYRKKIENSDSVDKIDHKDSKKRVDIFITRKRIVRYNKINPLIENIIVELKSPDVKLGRKECSQIETYMRLIKNTDQFNSTKAEWTFLLLGNEFLTTRGEKNPYIQDQIENNEVHGDDIVIYDKANNYLVKAKTWATIFDEFDIAHDFFLKELQAKQQQIEES